MLVPVTKKIEDNEKGFIERALPVAGELSVKVGDSVQPFDHLGECSFSQNEIILPKSFKPNGLRTDKRYYYFGSLLGKNGSDKVLAPYDGNLFMSDDKRYKFSEIDRKYILLSGVWGKVKSILEKRSVFLEAQTKDILFGASTEVSTSGELVVFPNPTDILKRSYLESFAKGIKGKIVYVGDFVGLDVVEKAIELEANGIIVGSAHKEVFDFAKAKNLAFGIISGFGKIATPDSVYKLLSSVSYRYVFFEGDKNLLKIPVDSQCQTQAQAQESVSTPEKISAKASAPIKKVTSGMNVQVLQDPYFGWIGAVDRTTESSIFVKFGFDKSSVEVKLPNFYIVE